ncbi:MAG: nitroreductase family protein [Roseburia sp.]|nr:nitroreductase family protein [Ruminococcus sp.]MCM1155563.1 nitroreductase family protein [Roseburia sp.]MCM1242412.1 nitroreductase family protein [Roseburia sp.]
MTAKECIKGRRSIRRFKADKITHELLSEIIETASYAPSWKNTQITRYIAVEGALKDTIAKEGTTPFPNNGKIIENAPMLIAVTVIKNRCGYERDGSFTTPRKDTWQMYDAGVASQSFCLAAYEQGVGSVILGIFDQAKIESLLQLPEDRELVALIPIGYPDETPDAPKRKPVSDLLSFQS